MPEGDTIWRTAAALHARLAGRVVLAARPRQLARLVGATVVAAEPVGKHVLIRFDSGLVLHSHLRMNGAWHLYAPGQRWQRPARLARAVIEVEDALAVLFSAPVVELIRDTGAVIGHLGPDILAGDFDPAVAVARARSLGPVPLGELLLDQRVCAGIGNVYKCEALWHLELDPWVPADRLEDARLRELYQTAATAMRSNLGGGARRFPGYGRGAVHGRGGRPCPRCGARIHVRAQGEHARLTYWCPQCQAEARSDG